MSKGDATAVSGAGGGAALPLSFLLWVLLLRLLLLLSEGLLLLLLLVPLLSVLPGCTWLLLLPSILPLLLVPTGVALLFAGSAASKPLTLRLLPPLVPLETLLLLGTFCVLFFFLVACCCCSRCSESLKGNPGLGSTHSAALSSTLLLLLVLLDGNVLVSWTKVEGTTRYIVLGFTHG
jgi:hypothetical protein